MARMGKDYITVLEAIERTVDKYSAYHPVGQWNLTGVRLVMIFKSHNKKKGFQRENLICMGELEEENGKVYFYPQKIMEHYVGASRKRKVYRQNAPELEDISDWKVTKYNVRSADRDNDMLIIYAEDPEES